MDNSRWFTFLLGVFGLGILAYLVLRRSTPPVIVYQSFESSGSSGVQPSLVQVDPSQLHRPVSTQTYNLVSSTAVRVATAYPDRETLVAFAAISPPGGAVVLATDLGTLNNLDVNDPTGAVTVLAVGANQLYVRLAPGDAVFAVGQIDGTRVSVTTQEA